MNPKGTVKVTKIPTADTMDMVTKREIIAKVLDLEILDRATAILTPAGTQMETATPTVTADKADKETMGTVVQEMKVLAAEIAAADLAAIRMGEMDRDLGLMDLVTMALTAAETTMETLDLTPEETTALEDRIMDLKAAMADLEASLENMRAEITNTTVVTACPGGCDKLKLEEKIEAIKKYQECDYVHPLTCGNDSSHELLKPLQIAGKLCLICPSCDYVQEYIPDSVYQLVEITEK